MYNENVLSIIKRIQQIISDIVIDKKNNYYIYTIK